MSMSTSAVLELDVENDSQIEVRDNDGFKGVFATEDISEDSVVFILKGTITSRPTMYTIELGRNQHLNFPETRQDHDDLDYCWQYLNHSCEPNGYMDTVGRTFLAARKIRRGEEITFNYLTTESVMAAPFNCVCGSHNCFRFIRGSNFLTRDQRLLIQPFVITHPSMETPVFSIQRQTGNLNNSFTSSR